MEISMVYLNKENVIKARETASVEQVLRKAGINPQMVLVRKGGEIIPDTETLRDKDRIEVIRVVSGG